ncbi:MAG: PucR family transcriptional regulator ligand-binding domain-containing protein [Bacillota bacterium]
MAIAVKDALENGPLKRAKLIAGHSGINKEIKFVNIMEVPQVVNWLKGGELLLTSGYVFINDDQVKKKIIYELAKKGVSAFGIKPGQFFQQVPEELVIDANNVGLPLIEIPRDMPYSDIMLPIFENVINEQYAKLKKAEEVHEQLFELLLRGGNIDNIANLMARLIENPVLIVDNFGNFRGKGFPNDDPTNEDISKTVHEYVTKGLQNVQMDFTPNKHRRIYINQNNTVLSGLMISVKAQNYLTGYIIIIELFKQLNEQDMMAIHHGTTITALEFSKERAVFEAEKRLGAEFLEDIIFGNYKDLESIERRASFVNFNLHQDKAVFIVNLEEMTPMSRKDKYFTDNLKSDVYRTVHSYLKDISNGFLLLSKSNRLVGLSGIKSWSEFVKGINKLAKTLEKIYSGSLCFCIGVGKMYFKIESVKTSYREALIASNLKDYMKKNVIFYEETGNLKLLFELNNSKILKKFYEDTIMPIIEHDKAFSTDLVATLETYFKNNENIRKTADALYLHKNTVIYRLKKIEELCSISLKDSEDKLNLQLAIKAKIIYS